MLELTKGIFDCTLGMQWLGAKAGGFGAFVAQGYEADMWDTIVFNQLDILAV